MGLLSLSVGANECQSPQVTLANLKINVVQWHRAQPTFTLPIAGYDSVTANLYVTAALRNIVLPLVAHYARGDEEILCAASELLQRYMRSLTWLFATDDDEHSVRLRKRPFAVCQAVPYITLELYTEDRKRMQPVIESAVVCTVLAIRYWRSLTPSDFYSLLLAERSRVSLETGLLLSGDFGVEQLVDRETAILNVIGGFVGVPTLFTFFDTFDCLLWDVAGGSASLPVDRQVELRAGVGVLLMFAELDAELVADRPWYTAAALSVIFIRLAFGDDAALRALDVATDAMAKANRSALVHRVNRIVNSFNDFTEHALYKVFFRKFVERRASLVDAPHFARPAHVLNNFETHLYAEREFSSLLPTDVRSRV